MDNLQSRSEMRKEQEKERRRVRDMQRRHSMSLDEKEKHLARRRRNYQLRRQRAESARLNPQTSIIMPTSEINHQVVKFEGESKSFEATKFQSLDIPAHLLATVRGNLRLNRLKRIARSFNGPAKFEATECDFKIDNVASECVLPMRLNHLKRVARSRNGLVKEVVAHNLETITECMHDKEHLLLRNSGGNARDLTG